MFFRPHPDRMAGHGMFLGWLIALLVLAVLVAVVIYAVIRLTSHHGPAAPVPVGGPPWGPRFGPFGPDPAIEQARMRYARGEIPRDDYLRLLGDLGWAGAPPPPPAPPAPPPDGVPA
jgi:hypothetical protein